MSEIRVRDADIEDLPRVVELLQQMSLDGPREEPGPPLPEAYYAAFDLVRALPGHRLLVIAHGRKVVGTASLFIVPNISYRGRPHAIVENVVVNADERGMRYGERLMRFCIEEARRTGCTRLSLSTDKRRTDAHRFYERLGFEASHLGYRYKL